MKDKSKARKKRFSIGLDYRVLTARVKGITADQPHKNFWYASKEPFLLERLDGIRGTGGCKSATMRNKRGYCFLIETYDPDKNLRHSLYRKLMSALLASGFNNIAAGLGLHPTTKPMLALADDLCGGLQVEFHSFEIIA